MMSSDGEIGFLDRVGRGDYVTKIEYPSRPKKPYILTMRAGELESSDIPKLAAALEDYTRALKEYESQKTAYNEDAKMLREKFENDLISDYGLSENPRAAHAFTLAWEDGHDEGFMRVAECFERYANLIQ